MIRLIVLLFLLVLSGIHCNHNPSTMDDSARNYVRPALALGERDYDSLDFYIGPKEIANAVHTSYPTLIQTSADISEQAKRLQQVVPETATDTLRKTYILAQLAAIQTRLAMLRGTPLDFDTEANRLFHITRLPDDQASIRHAALQRLDRELPQSPSRNLAARYTAYGSRFVVPGDKLQQIMQASLDLCRQRTLEHIALPPGEHVVVAFVRNKPWAAYSHYLGHAQSLLEINLDAPLTIDRALELACHEGYPGHHVANTLWDAALAARNDWPEAQIQLTFSPQGFASEALAAYAPRLAFTPAERARIDRDRLFPLIGIAPGQAEKYVAITDDISLLDSALPAIARDYLDGGLEFVRAGQRLEAEVLMEHSESMLLYLNEYRTYMLAYTDGKRRVAARVENTPDNSTRWFRYRELLGNLVPAI